MRDYTLGDTLDIKFTTRKFSTGAPFTLAGSPAVAAYEDNNTTEITAGITLSVDFDSRTGLNNVRVVASGGNGYAAGKTYWLVITAGTVDSVSVVGEAVGEFTLGRSAAFAAIPTVNAIADAVLKRDWTAISGEAARSLLNAARFLRNKWWITGSVLTVTKEDDTTTAFTSDLTTTPGSNPVTGSDPN
jgi:hypothetical protein